MNRGKYIVLEGPEGVGKTTQIQELARRLQAAGLPVRTLREPDSQSDLTARALRQLTQDPRYPMNTNTEVLLYNAARSQSLQVIKKSVEQGIICVVDRNYLTTLAIQYYGRGDVPDYETINRIISFAVNGVEPDLTIILDAPVPLLKERAKSRGQGERFDNLDEAFLERVRAGYLWEAKQRDLPVVFATDEPETIADNIWKLVADTLAMRTAGATATEPVSIKQIIDEKKNGNALPAEPPVTAEVSADNYFVPENLKPALLKNYRKTIGEIIFSYKVMQKKIAASDELAEAAITQVLPLATIFDGESGGLPKPKPELENLLKPNSQNTIDSSDIAPVKLTGHWPRNELDLLPELLYAGGHGGLDEIIKTVNSWPYDKKAKALAAVSDTAQISGAGYTFELLASYQTMLALQDATGTPATAQEPTPRYGWELPAVVEEAGLGEVYQMCFDKSLELYGALQAAGHEANAGYATLLGHKLRFLMTLNFAQLAELKASDKGPISEIAAKMLAAASEVHPLLAELLASSKQVAKTGSR